MKKKIIHIVPETRLGGIFTYIQRLTFYKKNSYEHYLFKGQPKLKGLFYYNSKPFNLRKYFSLLIVFDLLFNTPLYTLKIFKSNQVIFHTPFMIFHHILFSLIRKNVYLIFHDFNIPFPIKIIIKLFKPKNIFCASEVLKKNFKYLNFVGILHPFYNEKDLKILLNYKSVDFKKKENIIFLGNINRVKQIGEFCILFENYLKNIGNGLKLSIFGQIVDRKIYNSILNLNSEAIRIFNPIDHSKVNKMLMSYRFIVIPSESEVFPIIYYESLKANLIPLVNNIDFFRITAGGCNKHIFNINNSKSVISTFIWANNLEYDEYISYINKLKFNFYSFYKANNNEIRKVLDYI